MKTSSVGRFGKCTIPSTVVNSAASQTDDRKSPSVRSVPGPSRWIASNLRSESIAAPRLSSPILALPRGHGIGLVETANVRDRSPEAVVRLCRLVVREHELGPGLRRRRHAGPVRRVKVHDVADLGQERQEVGAGAVGGHIVERVRRLRPGERDPRGALVREVPQPVDHPGRDVAERLGVAAEQALALEPLVEVEDVDERGTALVRGPRDLAGQRLLPDVARHADELARLHVGAEADHEVGESPREIVVVVHGGSLTGRARPDFP